MWWGERRVFSQQIKASGDIGRASLWGKAKAGKKSSLFPQVLGGEEQGEQSRETRDASPHPSSSSPPAPRGTCGRKIPSAVSSPPPLQPWPGGSPGSGSFHRAGLSNPGCRCPLSPPKTSSLTAEGLVPLLGGKAAAVGQKHGSSWHAGERTSSRLAEQHSRASALRPARAFLLSHASTTFPLPKNNVGALPRCWGEELVLPPGHLLLCLLMGAASWASTGSHLVLVSASAHLFLQLSSHPFFLAALF